MTRRAGRAEHLLDLLLDESEPLRGEVEAVVDVAQAQVEHVDNVHPGAECRRDARSSLDAYLTGRHLMGRQRIDSLAGAIERFRARHARRSGLRARLVGSFGRALAPADPVEADGTDGIKRVMRDVAIADTGEPCGGVSGTFLDSLLGAALPCLEAGARLPGM